MNKEFLPIGTVCTLNGDEKKFMITAFLMNSETENGSVQQYDYCGCLYPEGMLDSEEHYVFNHSDISMIHYMGFVNEEEKAFKKELGEMLKAEMGANAVNPANVSPDLQQPAGNASANMQSPSVGNQLIDIPILVQQQNVVNPTGNQQQ